MYEQKSDNPIAEVNAFNFVPETIQLANFGSSHGQYAFDWGALKDRGIKCFNFALPSQSFEYDYALLNMHKDEFAEGSIAFIPISYFPLTVRPPHRMILRPSVYGIIVFYPPNIIPITVSIKI